VRSESVSLWNVVSSFVSERVRELLRFSCCELLCEKLVAEARG
jgi:hypothetical protein